MLLRESESMVSPISVIYYESYQDDSQLEEKLDLNAEKIQCIVGQAERYLPFGKAQHPTLWDFADGVDTRDFLNSLQ